MQVNHMKQSYIFIEVFHLTLKRLQFCFWNLFGHLLARMKHLSKWMVMILLLAVFSGYCSASAVDREAIRSIQELNQIRNAESLPPLLANDKLEEAAATPQ